MDNDGDGKTDYPFDPGCSSSNDNDETDDCYPTVGPSCPACGNGIDDDNDLKTDYPADTRCPDSSFFSENFCTKEILGDARGPITTPTTMGTVATATANYQQTCQTNTGRDLAYGLVLPVPVARLQIDTIGSNADTVISVWNESCSTEIECDDDGGGNFKSLIVRNNVAAGTYAILVDKFGTSTTTPSDFVLNVKGTVAAGTACTDPLFAAGVLACPTNTTCTAGTCQ
jgi:hypothetical protein